MSDSPIMILYNYVTRQNVACVVLNHPVIFENNLMAWVMNVRGRIIQKREPLFANDNEARS